MNFGIQPIPGLLSPAPTGPAVMNYQPGHWSQLAYQMAGSPQQGGMLPSVPMPSGTSAGVTSGGGGNSGYGGVVTGLLGALAKNPTLIKTLGGDVGKLVGGSPSVAGSGGATSGSATAYGTDAGVAPASGMSSELPSTATGTYGLLAGDSPALANVGTGAVMPAAQTGFDEASAALAAPAASTAASAAAPAVDMATGGAATAGDASGALGGALGPALGIAGLIGMGIADFTAKDPNVIEEQLLNNGASGVKTGIKTPTTIPGLAGLGSWVQGAGGGMSMNQNPVYTDPKTGQQKVLAMNNQQMQTAVNLLNSGNLAAYYQYMNSMPPAGGFKVG